MKDTAELIDRVLDDEPKKIVISNRNTGVKYTKVVITKKQIRGNAEYQFESFTDTQAFHENLPREAAKVKLLSLLEHDFRQLDAWGSTATYAAKLSKKGKLLVSLKPADGNTVNEEKHNREKNYLLAEGEDIPALRALGVFTPDGRVAAAMGHKYRQINRFLEMVDDAVGDRRDGIRVIDFGCGKSYLTFILYHYFTKLKGIDAKITGLDLKADVIAFCNKAAKEYGYTGLTFEVGDIGGYTPAEKPDMVVSLHACDTATDYALYNAVGWGTEIILSAPCCQHELNGQIKAGELSALTKYGIVGERFSALATDALRGCLLEACGYRTQLLEFVELEHSPKNILIRAVRGGVSLEKSRAALEEAERLMGAFSFRPTLYTLLKENNLFKR